MRGAAERLVAMSRDEDPYLRRYEEVLPLQIEAMAHRFSEQRAQIPILERRAADAGISGIRDFSDGVPLLFAHSVYKSYPDVFVTRGQWDLMSQWLGTLTATLPGEPDVREIDMAGVNDIDGWVERLQSHGHYLVTSSGTSGKCSFLHETRLERDLLVDGTIRFPSWVTGAVPRAERPVFVLGPSQGWHLFVWVLREWAKAWGRPDATYWLSDRPISVAQINRIGTLMRAMAEGRATPDQVAQSERIAREQQTLMRADLEHLIDAMLSHKNEPAAVFGTVGQYWMIMEMLQSRGDNGEIFHPDSILCVGGGPKGKKLPADYTTPLMEFFGVGRGNWARVYGMSEVHAPFPMCREGWYHTPPTVALFILDETGEQLLNPTEGEINGRVGLFDVTADSRWGGIISGDNVDARFSPCPCGRPGPTVTNITRYADLGASDDKLTCSGTLDAYVRGVIAS